MEAAFDECLAFRRKAEELIGKWNEIEPRLRALESYYRGPLWRRDFEDDEKGKFPRDLKRGVLSEDGVYDLLHEYDALLDELKEILTGTSGERK